MSRFFSSRHTNLTPYTPGEQPQDRTYIKLNTNESPFPPPKEVSDAVSGQAGLLQLYSDPESADLRREIAKELDVPEQQVIVSNGSDELLNFAFQAFADDEHPLLFPDITYGFYSVFAELNRIPYREIPLNEDLSVAWEAYTTPENTVVLANPNAPTGLELSQEKIEAILAADRDRIVILDEAYVDFGGTTALPLLDKYENLLIIRTFSKSRSMAGARLGFAVGSEALIGDLNTIRNSINPYNVNRMTSAAGIASLRNRDYFRSCCGEIIRVRQQTAEKLRKMGFTVTDSKANFLFIASEQIPGERLYRTLKEKGILVRHFDRDRIWNYTRVTVGNEQEMQQFLNAVNEILREERK